MKCKFCNFITTVPKNKKGASEVSQLRDHIKGEHPDEEKLIDLICGNEEDEFDWMLKEVNEDDD